eukprot:scaffold67247_cov33-Phaeocystis_antarctica.AAC.1
MAHPTPKDVYKLLGVRGPTPKDVYKLLGVRGPTPKEVYKLLGVRGPTPKDVYKPLGHSGENLGVRGGLDGQFHEKTSTTVGDPLAPTHPQGCVQTVGKLLGVSGPTPKDVHRLLGASGPTPKDVYKLLGV